MVKSAKRDDAVKHLAIEPATDRGFPSFVRVPSTPRRERAGQVSARHGLPADQAVHTLVVAIDLDTSADGVMRAAVEVAMLFQSRIYVVHAVSSAAFLSRRQLRTAGGSSSDEPAHAEGVLGWCRLRVAELCERHLPTSLPSEVVVRRGGAERVIRDVLDEVSPQLLVVGRSRTQGWGLPWRRGVGETICRRTNTAVMTLPR